MAELSFRLKELLPHQKAVRANAKRFNVICAGRRSGKSSIFEDLSFDPDNSTNGAMAGFPVAIFSPTYRMLGELWREISVSAKPIAKHIDKVEKRIELISGGIIEFWSLDNIDSVRGRKYKRALIDEAAMVRELKQAWNASIRPLLVDMKGDAWFFSTPKGIVSDFYTLWCYGRDGVSAWQSFQFPTSVNPLIDKDEIEEARRTLPAHVFAQEFLAQFVADDLSMWMYSFDEDRHVVDDVAFMPSYPVYVAVDFNNDPLECTLWQMSPTMGLKDSFIHCIDSFSVKSKVDVLGKTIRSKYPNSILYLCGDASGQNEDVGRHQTLYQVMAASMGIGKRQVVLNKRNLQYADSRLLCNTIMQNYPRFKISKKKAGELVRQMSLAAVDLDAKAPGTLKKDRSAYKLDMFDSFRYFLQTFFLKFAQKNYYKALDPVK